MLVHVYIHYVYTHTCNMHICMDMCMYCCWMQMCVHTYNMHMCMCVYDHVHMVNLR